VVYIVDDEEAVRQSIARPVRSGNRTNALSPHGELACSIRVTLSGSHLLFQGVSDA